MGMPINKERLEKYLFSDAIKVNGNWWVTRCDARFAFKPDFPFGATRNHFAYYLNPFPLSVIILPCASRQPIDNY
jgi:hypothetical protein